MINVLVKGTKYDAEMAAAWRQIPWVHCFETNVSGATILTETLGKVPDAFERQVVEWFLEQPNVAPFPAGTCLYYYRATTKQVGFGAEA